MITVMTVVIKKLFLIATDLIFKFFSRFNHDWWNLS